MSKSPKSLSTLASSLSLSRARTTTGNAVSYSIRAVDGCVVVHRRTFTAGTASISVSRRPASANSDNASNGSTTTTTSSGKEGGLLRSSNGSRALNRSFHSSSHSAHQQALPASSSSIHGPPLSPPTSSTSSSSSSSEALFQGRTTVPSSEGTLLLSSHHNPTQSGPSLIDPSSSSSSSSSTSSNPTTSNTNTNVDRATLFTTGTPTSYPSHPLPSFFGTSLNIARRSNLVFQNGAYGIPKPGYGNKGKEKALQLETEASNSDHVLSVGVGEDAYFLRPDSLGVADGVGGWSGHAGANPARWSRKLMHHCSAELARYENVEDELFLRYYDIDPVDVLQRAFEKSLAECKEEGVIGSSTALLAVLRNDELRLANMGDCCCSIIRGSDFIFQSEEQQHAFNFPFQAGTNSKDTPVKDAQRFNIKVQKDDIVILSSDGLLDNIFSGDVLDALKYVSESFPRPSSPPPPSSTTSPHGPPRFTLNRFSPQALSEALSLRAQSVYEDPRAVCSPFQQRANEEGIHYTGGKRDDITTLVGIVGELEASPDRR